MAVHFACPPEFVGVESVRKHGEALGLWRSSYYTITKEDLAIFGAWHPNYSRRLRELDCKKARLVTSSIGQMEMSGELPWLEQDFKLLERGVLDYIFFGSSDAYEVYKIRHENVRWFPYPICLELYPKEKLEKIPNSIGIFLPQHPRKNWAIQKAACELVKRKIPALQVFSNEGGWLPEQEYHELLGKLKIVLNVTHVESFSYATIDAIMHGTLPIISPCIEENLYLEGLHCEELIVCNADSAQNIVSRIISILGFDKEDAGYYDKQVSLLQNAIVELAEKNTARLKELLKGV